MSTYVDGKRIRYPKAGDWVRAYADPDAEKGMVTSVEEDGCVVVAWDEGDTYRYQPDTLYLAPSGWYWLVPTEEEVAGKTWG